MNDTVTRPQPTTTFPTIGRILHAYSSQWSGPRAAIVVNAWGGACCNVRVINDVHNDGGGTDAHLRSVSVYDALDDDGRQALRKAGYSNWLEWPPHVARC